MKWITPPVRLHISQIYHKNLGIPQVKFMLNIIVIGLMLAQPLDLPPLIPLTPENAAQIAQIARLGDGVVVTTAEDGRWRLEATTIGVRLTDLSAPDAPPRWLEGQNGAASVTFIPNQGYIASGGTDGSVIVWDIQSGEPILRRDAHLYSVSHLLVSPDGTLILSRDNSGVIRLWRLSDGRDLLTLLVPTIPRRGAQSPDPPSTLSAQDMLEQTGIILMPPDSERPTVDGDSIRIDQPPMRLVGAFRAFTSAALSPDRRLAAAGSLDGRVYVWDITLIPTLDPVLGALPIAPAAVLTGHTRGVTDVAFSADGTLLISTGYDGTVRLWGRAR
jgi:WD40 repeat protein